MFRRSISSDSQEDLLSSLIIERSSSSNAIQHLVIPEHDVEDNHCDDERSKEENISDERNRNRNYDNDNIKINNNNNNNIMTMRNNNTMMTSSIKNLWSTVSGYMNSTRLMVLLVLCLQNSLFTVLRRYSQGVLQENYSKVCTILVLYYICTV